MFSVASVCLSVCVSVLFNILTYESLDLESSVFGMQVRLQCRQVRFVYEGHWVKVKVTGAKSVSVYPVHG